MAHDLVEAEIVYRYADGGSVTFTLRSTKHDHPDGLDMLANRVMRMYREEVPAEEADE